MQAHASANALHHTHHVGEECGGAVDELGELVHLSQVAAVQQLLRGKEDGKGVRAGFRCEQYTEAMETPELQFSPLRIPRPNPC